MPLPTSDILLPGTNANVISFSLDPAFNVFHSMAMLAWSQNHSGLNEWVYQTAEQMTPEERDTHKLVIIGLYYGAQPLASHPSFPAYLDYLAALPPVVVRDKVMNAYIALAQKREGEPQPEIDEILQDVNSFMRYLRRGFPDDKIDPGIEHRAYTYLIDPPAMRDLLVGHMRHMWHKYLAVEWERTRPTLQKAVAAFQQLDLGAEVSRPELVRRVLGRESIEDCQIAKLEEATSITFIPSAHIGPYVGNYYGGGEMRILFGVRQPEGVGEEYPELSRAEILVRLSALADDSRLSILKLLSENSELRSQDIMIDLDLSQSAASRHLSQLTATGFLKERRCNGAKCYRLNDDRVEDTIRALEGFLLA